MPPPGEPMDADDLFMMFVGPEGDFGPDGFPDDGPAAPGGFRGFFGGAPLPPGQDGDFEDGDFGPDGGPQGGLGSLFGFGPQPPPGGDGDFGPDGFPDEQPSGGMAFFFGGPDKGGYMPPGMEGPEDGEGPPMDLFNAPGIWTSGGTTSFGGPAGEGMPMPPPGEPMDADDLFMMFAGPEGPEGDFGPDDGPAAPGGFRGFFGAPLPPGQDGEQPQPAGGITAVFGLTGGDAEPEEFQQDAAQTFFFGDKEELAPPPAEGAAQNGELNDSPPEVEETQTFFAPQEQEIDEENTFFNPDAEQEVVKEENSFFNANAEFEVDMPESTFLSPNEFTEQDYREKIAEQMGIDPNLVTVNVAAG